VDNIFSTKISEYQGHLFEVGLLLSGDGIEPTWRVEIRLLDPNGHPVEKGTIVLDDDFAEVVSADEAGVKAAQRLIDERFNGLGRINLHQDVHL
jgi:hypothetical protein